MIEQVTVDEISSRHSFDALCEEYAEMQNPLLPKPNFEKSRYLELEAAGILGVFCAMHGNIIAGLAAVIQGRMPKYRDPVAICESLYVRKAYRHMRYGLRLIDAIEDFALIRNLNNAFINVQDGHVETLGVLLERRNYSPTLHTYGIRLS